MSDNSLAIVDKPSALVPQEQKSGLVRRTIFELSPEEFLRLDVLAGMYAKASFNKGKSKEDYFLTMAKGMELGFQPMAAIGMISFVQGIPTLDGKGMLALIYASGLAEDVKIVGDDKSCTVIMKRKDMSHAFTYTFTMDNANALGLVKDGSNYKKQPKVMLKWRAVAGCAREAFPDILGGLYTVEEMSPENVKVSEDGAMEVEYPQLPESVSPAPQASAKSAEDVTLEALSKFKEACEKFFGFSVEDFLGDESLDGFLADNPTLDAIKATVIERVVRDGYQLRIYGVKTELYGEEETRYKIPFGFGSIYAYSRDEFEENTIFDAHGTYRDHVSNESRSITDIGEHSFKQMFKRDYLLLALRLTEAHGQNEGGKLAIKAILDPEGAKLAEFPE